MSRIFTVDEWKLYKFKRQTLNESNLFLHEINKKLSDRQPLKPDELLANKAKYEQEILDTQEWMRYYIGIEEQFNVVI